jgi:ankyrin repeat protein
LAIYLTDASGRTALDWAVARAQVEDVALLLSCGSDPNTMDITGRTAILHAVDSASTPCLRLLLEAGGEPNPKTQNGVFRSSPLTAAAMGGKKDMLRLLLEFDANANITNPEGLTPLHSVARFQDADSALVLLEHGADLNAISRDGRSPLTTAIIHNNHQVLQLFIDRCYEYMICGRLRGMYLQRNSHNLPRVNGICQRQQYQRLESLLVS